MKVLILRNIKSGTPAATVAIEPGIRITFLSSILKPVRHFEDTPSWSSKPSGRQKFALCLNRLRSTPKPPLEVSWTFFEEKLIWLGPSPKVLRSILPTKAGFYHFSLVHRRRLRRNGRQKFAYNMLLIFFA